MTDRMCITCGHVSIQYCLETLGGCGKALSQMWKPEPREVKWFSLVHITSKWHRRTKYYILTFKPSVYSLQGLFHCLKTEVTICLFLQNTFGLEIGFPGCWSRRHFGTGSHGDSLLGNRAAEVERLQEKIKTVRLSGLFAHSLNYSDRIVKKSKSTVRFHFTVNGFLTCF